MRNLGRVPHQIGPVKTAHRRHLKGKGERGVKGLRSAKGPTLRPRLLRVVAVSSQRLHTQMTPWRLTLRYY